MKNTPLSLKLALPLFVFSLLVSSVVEANAPAGALSFIAMPKTVTAGKANSWMKPIWDFQVPSSASIKPDVAREFTVQTESTSNGIKFTFTIPDTTRSNKSTKCNGTTTSALCKGDTIRIFIDPNNSRENGLQLDNALNNNSPQLPQVNPSAHLLTDHRFDIDLGNIFNPVGSTVTVPKIRHLIPKQSGGITWDKQIGNDGNCNITGTSTGGAGGGGGVNCNVQYISNNHKVIVDVSWVEIGKSTVGDFGLAIALINDLGVNNSADQPQLTASSFPLTMPVNNSNNPYEWTAFSSASNSGVWSNPSQWGLGFVTTPSSNLASVSFDLMPASWLAGAIRLSRCGVTKWADSLADSMNNGVWKVEATNSNQASIPGWYKYYPADTCQMGVWVKTNNASPSTVRGRLLVLWGHPNAGNSAFDWSKVTLTAPMDFPGSGESITREVWANVVNQQNLFQGSGLHACMRVYLLPENPTLDQNKNVFNDNDLTALQSSNSINPAQIAQMNFTNLAGQGESCAVNGSEVEKCSFPITFYKLQTPLLRSVQGADIFLAENTANLNTVGVKATDVSVGRYETNVPRPEGKSDPMVRVDVTAFGVEQSVSKQPYIFIEEIGGLGWTAPIFVYNSRKLKPFTFQVGNPSVGYINYATTPPTIVPAPTRKIFLATHVTGEQGATATVNILPLKDTFAPGEATDANAIVTVVPQLPVNTTNWTWLQWLLLIMVILLFLWLNFWRKSSQP